MLKPLKNNKILDRKISGKKYISINIAKDFSPSPGSRYISEGPFSGEEFREKIFIPMYNKAREEKKKLLIDFDGGYGYSSSFLEEVFGGFNRKFLNEEQNLLDTIIIKSDEEPGLKSRLLVFFNII